ncbi:MAG: dTDP-4-dehydrorhamnose 3,5-epimerase [Hyphomonadaceae bacterium]|nr:dTDP-4-dehydrorhamnose 3,5-epimerase [Hyphomonadaceae bacterium]
MDITPLAIPDVLVLNPRKFADHRGFLSETFRADAMTAFGVDFDWLQENHSFSAQTGTVRALHFQAGAPQAKLVRVLHGAIFDVAVDLRRGSPTYGSHVSAVLSAENWMQIYVPAGFAHGFCTLAPETSITYKSTAYWQPALEGGLRWDDPDLAIDWPVKPEDAILSDRDRQWAPFADFESPFAFTAD